MSSASSYAGNSPSFVASCQRISASIASGVELRRATFVERRQVGAIAQVGQQQESARKVGAEHRGRVDVRGPEQPCDVDEWRAVLDRRGRVHADQRCRRSERVRSRERSPKVAAKTGVGRCRRDREGARAQHVGDPVGQQFEGARRRAARILQFALRGCWWGPTPDAARARRRHPEGAQRPAAAGTLECAILAFAPAFDSRVPGPTLAHETPLHADHTGTARPACDARRHRRSRQLTNPRRCPRPR